MGARRVHTAGRAPAQAPRVQKRGVKAMESSLRAPCSTQHTLGWHMPRLGLAHTAITHTHAAALT